MTKSFKTPETKVRPSSDLGISDALQRHGKLVVRPGIPAFLLASSSSTGRAIASESCRASAAHERACDSARMRFIRRASSAASSRTCPAKPHCFFENDGQPARTEEPAISPGRKTGRPRRNWPLATRASGPTAPGVARFAIRPQEWRIAMIRSRDTGAARVRSAKANTRRRRNRNARARGRS